jgi:hypothetical protein
MGEGKIVEINREYVPIYQMRNHLWVKQMFIKIKSWKLLVSCSKRVFPQTICISTMIRIALVLNIRVHKQTRPRICSYATNHRRMLTCETCSSRPKVWTVQIKQNTKILPYSDFSFSLLKFAKYCNNHKHRCMFLNISGLERAIIQRDFGVFQMQKYALEACFMHFQISIVWNLNTHDL